MTRRLMHYKRDRADWLRVLASIAGFIAVFTAAVGIWCIA